MEYSPPSWPDYRFQRPYSESTQTAAVAPLEPRINHSEKDEDEEEIKEVGKDRETEDDDLASPSGLFIYIFKHDSFQSNRVLAKKSVHEDRSRRP